MRRASRHRARYALRRGRGVRAGAARGVLSDGGASEEGSVEGMHQGEEGSEVKGSSDEGAEGSEEEGREVTKRLQ